MTGGNYWMPDVILYQNTQGTLRLGGGLTATRSMRSRPARTARQQQLNLAASLSVSGNTLKVTNLTGHKLISGYPEGRRMWLNIKWYDAGTTCCARTASTDVADGQRCTPVKSIVNLYDPNTKIYEAHYGMTQEWANQLLALGYPAEPAAELRPGHGASATRSAARGAGARHLPRDLPLRAEQHRGQGQPHPALRHDV
jgi:hypothetical protein